MGTRLTGKESSTGGLFGKLLQTSRLEMTSTDDLQARDDDSDRVGAVGSTETRWLLGQLVSQDGPNEPASSHIESGTAP